MCELSWSELCSLYVAEACPFCGAGEFLVGRQGGLIMKLIESAALAKFEQ